MHPTVLTKLWVAISEVYSIQQNKQQSSYKYGPGNAYKKLPSHLYILNKNDTLELHILMSRNSYKYKVAIFVHLIAGNYFIVYVIVLFPLFFCSKKMLCCISHFFMYFCVYG